jgi:hypothetical protein
MKKVGHSLKTTTRFLVVAVASVDRDSKRVTLDAPRSRNKGITISKPSGEDWLLLLTAKGSSR